MPSTYTPPDVIVTQVRRTNLGNQRPPQLPVVVVGPARQIETRVNAGTYDATVELNVPIPSLTAGAVVDTNSIQILLDATSDNGKPVGLFALNNSEYTVINDANNLPSRLLISGDITLEVSVLSSRNNQAGSTENVDRGSGTPEGIVFSDSAVDFLARGATPSGDSFIVIDSPASMAGVYKIIEMIATGNVVRSVVVEKVNASDYDQPELVKNVVIDGAETPTGSVIRGFDAATHEAALIGGATSNLTTASTALGIGVVGAVDLDGAGTTSFDSTAISAILASSARLYLPGIGSSEQVTFAPVDAGGSPANRSNALWTSAMANVQVGNFLRARYAALIASGTGTISGITYTGGSAGTIVFSTSNFVQAGWTGRTITLSGNGASANNISYEIISVNTGTNSVVVDLTPFNGVFPGGASGTYGTAVVEAQDAMDRDFKVLAVDRVAKSVVVSALGNASVANDIITLPTPSITSFSFLEVVKSRSSAINGAGDFVTFAVDGAPYRYEVDTATPSAIAVVGTLPSFAATVDVLATSTIAADPLTNFGAGSPVIKLSTNGIVSTDFIGKTARVFGNTGNGNNGDYLITDVSVGDNTITVSGTFPTPATEDGSVSIINFIDVPVVYRRGVPFRNSAASYDIIKRLSDGWTADVEVSYQADRKDLPLEGIIELGSRKDVETVIGPIHPDNPLAMGCDMIVRTGLADGIRTFYALATNGPGVGDFTDALGYLETVDVYYVVPLTQNKDIISVYKSHVDTQSQPANKHERVLLASTELTTVNSILATTVGTLATASTLVATADWGVVSPGDVVKILVNPGTAEEAVEVENRITEIDLMTNTVTVLSPWDAALIGTTRSFKVDSFELTKSEQAEDWRDYSASLKDSRVTIIRPDQCEISFTDKTVTPQQDRTVTVGTQYACAAWAGLAAALSPDAPLTNVSIPGIRRLIHSNDYFRPDQLNTIAEGGNNILVQESRNSVPYSRHQLTTDMESLITREFSIVKIVDYAAKYVRNSLKPYIGNKNITPMYLSSLRGTTEAVIRALVKAGVLLQKTELLTLRQDPDSPDQIIIEIALDIPYPANRILVTLYV